jgi:hypothetical protein
VAGGQGKTGPLQRRKLIRRELTEADEPIDARKFSDTDQRGARHGPAEAGHYRRWGRRGRVRLASCVGNVLLGSCFGRVRLQPDHQIEDSDQQQLIEEIVLEPEDDLFVPRTCLGDPPVGSGEPLLDALVRRVAAVGQKPGAHIVPCVAVHRWAWAFVQHVSRRDHRAVQDRLQLVAGVVAVGDVQSAHGRLRVCIRFNRRG